MIATIYVRMVSQLAAILIAWLLLTPNIEKADRFSDAALSCCWYILDSFESKKECENSAARIRQEAFRALERLRKSGEVSTLLAYGSVLYTNPPRDSDEARKIYSGRSRVRCEEG